jgi:hypothetical protein
MKLKCFAAIILAGGVSACIGVKPYEKEFLLHPLMDDSELQSIQPSDFRALYVGDVERLSNSGSVGQGASACPTCGG